MLLYVWLFKCFEGWAPLAALYLTYSCDLRYPPTPRNLKGLIVHMQYLTRFYGSNQQCSPVVANRVDPNFPFRKMM